MSTIKTPFNKPYMTGKELFNIAQAHFDARLSGDGPFTRKCHDWLEQQTGTRKALLTHSCTAALEMCALLLDIQPGDEVIMPSFTFVSTANAFVLRGATPVFVDIRPDTANIDETLIESAITARTKAIVVVHYAGIACEMDAIMALASKHRLVVVEDAAQGVQSRYKDRSLGAIGHLGAYSFHETKNVISGEGGALLVNDRALVSRAEIIREKGTDRSRFLRGEVDKYTWQEVGSSFLPGELIAAFLHAQLEQAERITEERLRIWQIYHDALAPHEQNGLLRRPVVPTGCQHNAHMYYILVEDGMTRDRVLSEFRKMGIGAIFHYVPLHSSPAGLRLARISSSMQHTDDISSRLIRLPLWIGLESETIERIAAGLDTLLG